MSNYREVAYALLRATLGLIFLTTGIVKFTLGLGNFAAGLQQEFANKLPMVFVISFAYVLPFGEVAAGAMLIVGLFNVIALIIGGLLLMVLTFGKTAVNDSVTVAGNLSYVLIIFVLLCWPSIIAIQLTGCAEGEQAVNRSRRLLTGD